MAGNYIERIWDTSPGSAFQGKSIIGIYVGRESCPHCGPLLYSLMVLLQCRSKATIVFVSKGASEEDTMQYFYTMPMWTAMPHATAAGSRVMAPLAKFSVTTIPALVLLDSNGRVVCTNAHVCLAADPPLLGFPWQAPAGTRRLNPTVDFAMGPVEAPSAVGDRAPSQPVSLRHKSAGALPPGTLHPHWLERDRATRAPAVPGDVADNIHQALAGIHARAQLCIDAKRKSPLDIVDAGRPPKELNQVATQVVPTIYPDAMQVVCDRERA
jgi:hypothetical protein